ncbi:hypothetical protein [Nibricoccus sp. IMCC34717]|uniref:hypothetical protein n=1 Tax=Nibricoccus sp. IMCC34717 TaxID=3034021 RepID=UPI00384E9DA1
MSEPLFPNEEYTVMHFTLIPSEEGKPMQKSQVCGVYKSVEEAFLTARLLAVREWQRLRALATTGTDGSAAPATTWQVIDTEFGYDLKRDHLVVARFWIYAKPVIEA